MESQNKLIAEHLRSGKQITALDALYKFNCFRLSARIYDLRKRGMVIGSKTTQIISGGKNKYITTYYERTAKIGETT